MVHSHSGVEGGGGLEMSDKLIKLLSCGRNSICTTVDHELHSSTLSPQLLGASQNDEGRGTGGGAAQQ